jgi:hypothetical protein
MNGKVTRFLDYFQGFLPGGVVRSDAGAAIHISANGTSTVPAKELQEIIFKRFDEMKVTDPSKGAAELPK